MFKETISVGVIDRSATPVWGVESRCPCWRDRSLSRGLRTILCFLITAAGSWTAHLLPNRDELVGQLEGDGDGCSAVRMQLS